jgi:hypothetical protein
MSAKAKASLPEHDEANLEEEAFATNQEAVPLPWMAGTNRVALRWLAPALGMLAEQAPDERPGKK